MPFFFTGCELDSVFGPSKKEIELKQRELALKEQEIKFNQQLKQKETEQNQLIKTNESNAKIAQNQAQLQVKKELELEKIKSDFEKEKLQIEKQKNILQGVDGDISLNTVLNSEECQEIISECRVFRNRKYTPIKTICMFVKQMISPDKSCKNAVTGSVLEKINENNSAPSINTGPYCKARKRLPKETLHKLVQITGKSSVSHVEESLKWHGRTVKLVDGTTLTMADTEDNQKEFPQHGNQKEGVGFPIARLVAIMSLEIGTVIDYAYASYNGKGTGEHSLFRKIMDCIVDDDVLLGDCYYPSFF